MDIDLDGGREFETFELAEDERFVADEDEDRAVEIDGPCRGVVDGIHGDGVEIEQVLRDGFVGHADGEWTRGVCEESGEPLEALDEICFDGFAALTSSDWSMVAVRSASNSLRNSATAGPVASALMAAPAVSMPRVRKGDIDERAP
ncbi:MAG: hypothetical protein KF705_10020 [Phycisphaeraceae bacterium]|nr:hypothetical protein [Phycisphaeraceae bacterium]